MLTIQKTAQTDSSSENAEELYARIESLYGGGDLTANTLRAKELTA